MSKFYTWLKNDENILKFNIKHISYRHKYCVWISGFSINILKIMTKSVLSILCLHYFLPGFFLFFGYKVFGIKNFEKIKRIMNQEYELCYQKIFQQLRSERFPRSCAWHKKKKKYKKKLHLRKINTFFATLRI